MFHVHRKIAASFVTAAALVVGGLAFVGSSTHAFAWSGPPVLSLSEGGCTTASLQVAFNGEESNYNVTVERSADATFTSFTSFNETSNTQPYTFDVNTNGYFRAEWTSDGGPGFSNTVFVEPTNCPSPSPSPTSGCVVNPDSPNGSCETPPVVKVTVCSVDSTAQGGAISWSGADSKDTFHIFASGIPTINVTPVTASGSYGPLEGGHYTYQFTDNTNEIFNGSFTIARCAVPTPELTPPPVPSTGAGRG